MLATLAELLHAAGEPYPALGAGAMARALEIAMEARFSTVPRYHHFAKRTSGMLTLGRFLLAAGDPAETKYLTENPLEDLTNMALARQLEITKGRIAGFLGR